MIVQLAAVTGQIVNDEGILGEFGMRVHQLFPGFYGSAQFVQGIGLMNPGGGNFRVLFGKGSGNGEGLGPIQSAGTDLPSHIQNFRTGLNGSGHGIQFFECLVVVIQIQPPHDGPEEMFVFCTQIFEHILNHNSWMGWILSLGDPACESHWSNRQG